MARSLQAPAKVRLPDPPAVYDRSYMRTLIGLLETAMAKPNQPVGQGFAVTNRDTTAITLDVATATLPEIVAFVGELAAALITNNKLGGTA